MKKGDIVLIPFPFTDLKGSKNRPALILCRNRQDVTVCFITSEIKWQEKLDVVVHPSTGNGLKVISLVRISKIATIDAELVLGRLGSLNEMEVNQINKSLVALFNL